MFMFIHNDKSLKYYPRARKGYDEEMLWKVVEYLRVKPWWTRVNHQAAGSICVNQGELGVKIDFGQQHNISSSYLNVDTEHAPR